jgi:hypothetical protein
VVVAADHGAQVVVAAAWAAEALAVVMEICGLVLPAIPAPQIPVAVVAAPFSMVMHQWLVELVDRAEPVDQV